MEGLSDPRPLAETDNRERFDCCARKLAGFHDLLRQQPRKVDGRTERPFLADAHQIDPARGVLILELRKRRFDVHAVWQAARQHCFVQRLAGGKQQGFQQPHFLRSR